MIEVMEWIGQDSAHFFGTLLFIWIVGCVIEGIIRK